ncbi:MATE family efflux transporter [Anaerotruncus colihominis]|uniref:MATE family efflux transporter n=2 Tax=Anaerotruncus colihominis TaxID=169435 RepID=A0A845RCH8_9FIRM|nr:MATE family efflux transporter [Anaerotruncus colihominis]NBI77524.1 MATE family efflux transporter [Anaerotruncus colihominis]
MEDTATQKRAFYHTLSAMVIPIAFQNLMTALVSASDAVMLGFLEQEALSAVSLAGQVTFVFNLCVTVLVQGTTMLAAQYWGKGERDTVERILALAMRYMAFVAVAFLTGTLLFPEHIMSLLTNETTLIIRGAKYLQIAGISYVPLGLSQMYLCIMKNSGKTAKSTVIGSSSMILNLCFNAVFIFGLFGFPAMGISGAALATVLATAIQFVWTLAEAKKGGSIKIRLSYIVSVDQKIRQDFNRYTLPVVGNYFFWGGGVTIFSVIIGHLGNDAVAANSLANIVRNILGCVSKGVGTAGAILVGNELGKNQIELAKKYAKHSTVLAGMIGIVTCLIIVVMRPLILDFSHLTETATAYLSGMLRISSYYAIAGSVNNMVIGGIFCAGGKSKFGCICDGIVLWLIIIPAASLAAFYFHLPVLPVYFILCLDECIKVPVVFWYYRKYTWAQNLTEQ